MTEYTHTQEFQSEKINYSSRVLCSLYLTFSYISAYVKMKLEIDINISIASRKDTDSTWESVCSLPRVTQLVNDGINVSLHTVILDNGKLKKKKFRGQGPQNKY